MTTVIVASMNRAFQCDSLLRSLDDHCAGVDRVVVVARATSALHREAYARLFSSHLVDYVLDIEGYSVHLGRVVRGLPKHDFLSLMVDDQIFYRHADFSDAQSILVGTDALVWSWRLGFDSRRCSLHVNHWRSRGQTDDYYGYLWHSDAGVYRVGDWVSLMDTALPGWDERRRIPNDLEAAGARLQRKAGAPHPLHVGPILPACVTWQINKEVTTRSCYSAAWQTTSKTSLDALAHAFLEGRRFDNDAFSALTEGPHFGAVGHVPATRENTEFYERLIR